MKGTVPSLYISKADGGYTITFQNQGFQSKSYINVIQFSLLSRPQEGHLSVSFLAPAHHSGDLDKTFHVTDTLYC